MVRNRKLGRSFMTVRVVAHIRAKEGKGAALGDVLQSLIAPTRGEPGNISYELLASLDDERDYTFVEEFLDGNALAAHMKTPHVEAATAAMAGLVEGEVDMRTYRLIG
jgi:quinol monooxygenase YgiN